MLSKSMPPFSLPPLLSCFLLLLPPLFFDLVVVVEEGVFLSKSSYNSSNLVVFASNFGRFEFSEGAKDVSPTVVERGAKCASRRHTILAVFSSGT